MADRQKNSSESVLARSTSSAFLYFASTALRKALTFTLNLLLVRQVTAETLGGRSDFELVLGSILFLSREACALVLLRAPVGILIHEEEEGADAKRGKSSANLVRRQQFINTAWLPVPLGLLLISVVSLSNYGISFIQGGHVEFDTASVLFFISILIEVFASPFVLLAQALLLASGRATTDIHTHLPLHILLFLLIPSLHFIPFIIRYGDHPIIIIVPL